MKKNSIALALTAAFLLVTVSCAGAPKEEQAAPPPMPAESPQPENAPVAPQAPQPLSPAPQATGGIILEGAYIHTVKYQDTLSDIAERFYGRGKGYYYGLIMLASNITDPNLIISGKTLTIPVLQRNLDDPGARSRLKAYSLEIADILAGGGYSRDARNMRALANSL